MVLTNRSLQLMNIGDPEKKLTFIEQWQGQPLVATSTITCMDAIKLAIDEVCMCVCVRTCPSLICIRMPFSVHLCVCVCPHVHGVVVRVRACMYVCVCMCVRSPMPSVVS